MCKCQILREICDPPFLDPPYLADNWTISVISYPSPSSMPGIFAGISCKFTREYHRKNNSMWEIFHIRANSQILFIRTR